MNDKPRTTIAGQAEGPVEMLVKVAAALEPNARLVYYFDNDTNEFGIVVITNESPRDMRYGTREERDADLALLQEQFAATSLGELEIGSK